MANKGIRKWWESSLANLGAAVVLQVIGYWITRLTPIIGGVIWGLLGILGVYLIWRAYKQERKGEYLSVSKRKSIVFSRKEQAYKELAKLIELGQKLWDVKELVQKGYAPFEDKEIQKILADVQKERNLPENARIGDSMLEEKFDALVSLYMKFTEFDFPHNPEVLEGLNSLQTTIRQYINQYVKD